MATAESLILATRKGVLIYERSGRARPWTFARHAHFGASTAYADADPRTGTLWAGLAHGHWGAKLHRSGDMGRTWAEIPLPAFPAGSQIKPGVPATVLYPWVIAFGLPEQPGRLYLGTVPGGLFVSDDGGATWSLNQPLWDHPSRAEKWFGAGFDHPGVHSVLVDPRDSRRWLIGVSVAGVFETTDDGATWAPRNSGLRAEYLPDPAIDIGHDPHLIARCAGTPDVLWQQNHCGIYRSEDGARSWHAISRPRAGHPAHFGFAVTPDPANPRRAWVVPADSDEVRAAVDGALCVCRTDDGGKTWTACRRGLPQSGVYDITYRHALDRRGESLVFGTTTGNLYASDDDGESWTCLSNTLPPIHSVRLASAG